VAERKAKFAREEEARRIAVEEARRKAEEEARRKAEKEARRKAEKEKAAKEAEEREFQAKIKAFSNRIESKRAKMIQSWWRSLHGPWIEVLKVLNNPVVQKQMSWAEIKEKLRTSSNDIVIEDDSHALSFEENDEVQIQNCCFHMILI
jgi:hypothetical protein